MNAPCFPWAGRIVVIAPECMGYRSLSAMALLALVLIIWQRPGFFRSCVLMAGACVLAVLGNLCRIGTLLVVMKFLPDEWYMPVHDVAGFVAILVESVLLSNFCDWLKSRPKSKEQEVKDFRKGKVLVCGS